MDVRLTSEQQQLRDAAAKLADDLGPDSVAALADESRIARLDKQIGVTGWRSLRSDEAFLGPVLADDLVRNLDADPVDPATIVVADSAFDARGYGSALQLDGTTVCVTALGDARGGA